MQSTLRSRLLPAFALLLGFAIFCWGLQSKLSLYQPPSPGHPAPVAKIIQDNQANKKASAAILAILLYSAVAALAFWSPAIDPVARILRIQLADAPPSRTETPYSQNQYFRPPPSFS
jgi:hypothetical protein